MPDLLQFIALRARLEDLDGVPVININDVPLQGFNAVVKRAHRRRVSRRRACWCSPFRCGDHRAADQAARSPGPVFYRQERMGLDGKPFTVYKFRSMTTTPKRDTGPVWAREDDPRCTPVGRFLRRSNLDELPQLWNVLQRRHVDRRPAARSGRSSSSSSSTASRSTCCATR